MSSDRFATRHLPRGLHCLLLCGLFHVGVSAVGYVESAAAQASVRDTVISPAPFERELTDGRCPNIPGLESYRCFESERGWVFTNDSVRAHEILLAVREAATRFEKIFAKPVARGIVFHGAGEPDRRSEVRSAIEKAGARWSWSLNVTTGDDPFPGTADSATLVASRPTWEAANREAILQRRPGMTTAQLPDTLAKLWAARVQYLLHNDDFLTHEIAHKWFQEAYPWTKEWNPAWQRPRPSDWIGRAKWLNEAVGILMEGAYTRRGRLQGLVSLYRRDTAYVVPLDTLFNMPHPMNGPHGPMSGQYDVTYAQAFYAHISGLIDFLLERTKDVTIFGAIAANEAAGSTMAEWLQKEGPSHNLPATVSELDRAWREWFAKVRSGN